ARQRILGEKVGSLDSPETLARRGDLAEDTGRGQPIVADLAGRIIDRAEPFDREDAKRSGGDEDEGESDRDLRLDRPSSDKAEHASLPRLRALDRPRPVKPGVVRSW